jgi:murein DD-endopeptidase MepM/ murein hydrolase activator NlpD
MWFFVLVVFSLVGGTASVLSAAETPMKLPFPQGEGYVVMQGNYGAYTHNNRYNFHAWDFATEVGTPVTAAAAGRVVLVKDDSEVGGADDSYLGKANTIGIDHGWGVTSRYVHLHPHTARVKVGELVQAGQVIGQTGMTGKTSKPHLHFGLMDPFLDSMPGRFVDVPIRDGIPIRGDFVVSQAVTTKVNVFRGDSTFSRNAFAAAGVELLSPLRCFYYEEGSRLSVQFRVTQPIQELELRVANNEKVNEYWKTRGEVAADGTVELALRMQKPWHWPRLPADGYRVVLIARDKSGADREIFNYRVAIAPSIQVSKKKTSADLSPKSTQPPARSRNPKPLP